MVVRIKDLFKRFFKPEETKPEPRRKCFPRIDCDMAVKKRPANVVFLCDRCNLDTTDPPELCIFHNEMLNQDFYHVRCPKCWQCTGFFVSEEEALEAWNKHERGLVVESNGD